MSDDPMVCLYAGHALTSQTMAEGLTQPVDYVAPGQSWSEKIDGQDVTNSGTVILLNLSRYPIDWYKPMKRVTAVLHWQRDNKPLCAVATRPVNLGNASMAWVWTITLGAIALGCILGLSRARSGSVMALLCADDGHLSLALTQVGLWTVAVGGVTFFYGMIRFEVPVIPNSILILMGLSLATAGLGAAAPPQTSAQSSVPVNVQLPAPIVKGETVATRTLWKFSDLIYLFPKQGVPQPSLARAQMLFWTVIIIVLFVAKSAIDGILWDVPAGMVALMGFSQAGYIGPKFLGPYAGPVGN
jgi:hypothetical protein